MAPAAAAPGPANGGFESGLDGWTATVVGAGGASSPAGCVTPKRGVCAVGADTFTWTDAAGTGHAVTVTPPEGTAMARLGGPFLSATETQQIETYRLERTVTVDPAAPVVTLAYNAFYFEYDGYDRIRIRARLGGPTGPVVAERAA
ncbi:MAG: hypothetical protein AB1416_12145, partial [Actinomycetota bacterium]